MDGMGSPHMNAEDVERYSLGSLSDEEAAGFDEHLLICELCRSSVEASDEYVASMRAAARKIRGKGEPALAKAPGKATRHVRGNGA